MLSEMPPLSSKDREWKCSLKNKNKSGLKSIKLERGEYLSTREGYHLLILSKSESLKKQQKQQLQGTLSALKNC